jgi:aminoglycoside 3-N-acetyltransferase
MAMRNIIRKITPKFIIEIFRGLKKYIKRNSLLKAEKEGTGLSQSELENQLRACGIQEGATLLVHASLSKIGPVQGGALTVVNALVSVLGPKGNLLMPSSPVSGLQLEYVSQNPVFDARNTPSRMGAISEVFRTLPGVLRSLHPTEPVCAVGPDADFLTNGHFNQLTPYNADSPFSRLYELNGKILYLGVSLDNAGTHLHTLEDAVDFPYPVYHDELFKLKVIDVNNQAHWMTTKVHNPDFSRRRKCDALIPLFLQANVAKEITIGLAPSLLFEGDKMFSLMQEAFINNRVTMYTPNGEKL